MLLSACSSAARWLCSRCEPPVGVLVPEDCAGWVHSFAAAAETYPACIVISDMSMPGNPMFFVNAEFCRVTGYAKTEAQGCFETAPDGSWLRTRGLLLKKGSGTGFLGRRNWSQRWMKLDFEKSELKYYADASLRKEKGSVFFGAASRFGQTSKTFKGKTAKDVKETFHFNVELVIDGLSRNPRKGTFYLRAANQRTTNRLPTPVHEERHLCGARDQ